MTFFRALRTINPSPARRRWLYVPYDQLSDALGPLSREPAETLGIVLVEAPWKATRRPYHKQKLATVLANQRHFALEQAARGVAVRYVIAESSYAAALAPVIAELGVLRVMQPAERELRMDIAPLVQRGGIEVIAHEGWLTSRELFVAASGAQPPWRMDAFYRQARRSARVLVDGRGQPEGGKFSFDTENRKAWRGQPPAPPALRFDVDEITAEVGALIETRFAAHPGTLQLEALPTTHAHAQQLWTHAKEQCLPWFGPYEDAMSHREPHLFHTRVSALVNLHRLLPRDLVRDVVALDLPLPSKEGFVRQVLGWREYMHHVHVETDGFRSVADVAAHPGDGGYARWAGAPWPGTQTAVIDGGATTNFMASETPLPPTYWGTPSGLDCIDTVIRDVWRDGYSHHISRLMVLSNLAQLLDVSPRALTDWFWVAYVDAYDWVVEPNVLAMSTFSAGDLATTKPYVAGAAYIDRMSDYCKACQFDPATTCPFTRLYWAYLARHEARLARNPRMHQVMVGASKRGAEDRVLDTATFARTRDALVAGETLRVADFVPLARVKRRAK